MTEAYAFADAALLDDKNGGVGYLVYTVPEGEKLIGTNFKLNPNATLGYSDGKYYYRPDDWYDEAFGNSNLRQEYNVSVAGASDKINYYMSTHFALYMKFSWLMSHARPTLPKLPQRLSGWKREEASRR